jgi:uncharacterized linocin/CFP29 family protein
VSLGRESLDWTPEVWDRLDKAVYGEVQRTSVAAGFLPLVGPVKDALTVSADVIEGDRLAIAEGQVRPIVELWVDFTMTPAQVQAEAELSAAMTLATRGANLLAQAEDSLIFRGDAGRESPVFALVRMRQSAGLGLVDGAEDEIEVRPIDAASGHYGERTFASVAEGYSRLQARGQYGPYALALHDKVYADTLVPLAGTLVTPADRIRPLVSQGFVGSGALPPSTGVLVSVGGSTVDLVIGNDATTGFSQIGAEGLYHFRVSERFVLRIKDRAALVRLRFAAK